MKSTFVFATAESRLHADIMTIRLRRAEIEPDRISAVFLHRFAPNSFFWLLERPRRLRSTVGREGFCATGSLLRILRNEAVEAMPEILRKLGLDRPAAERLGESLRQGHAMLGVQVRDEDEMSIAWHVFRHAHAENIAIATPRAREKAAAAWSQARAAA